MAIPLLTFTVKDEKANVSKELNHIKEVKRSSGINETISLSFRTVDRPSNIGYSLVEGENLIVYQGHEYRIKQVSKMPSYKNVVCTHIFSDLVGVQRHSNIVGTFTLESCVGYVLSGTGWSFTVDADVSGRLATFGEDQFGKGNVVKLIEAICKDIFKVEFEILPNKIIRFTSRLSSDRGNKYEYGKNIKTISEKFDSTSLRTQIMGTYEITEGQDEDGNDIKVERSIVYTSPNANVYGIIEAEPITDSEVQNDFEMLTILQERLNDEIQYSLDISAVDFGGKELGETVTVNHSKMGIVGSKARILQLDETVLEVDGVFKLVPDVITLGNYVFGTFQTKVKDKINKLEDEINKLKKRQPSIFLLSSWRIGNLNALALPNVVLPNNATLPTDITAELQFDKLESLTGQSIKLKSSFQKYHVQVTEYTKTGTVTFQYTDEILKTKKYPYADLVGIALTITEVPLSQFVEGTHRKQVVGIKFQQTANLDGFLDGFEIGNENMMLFASDETGQVASYITGNTSQVIANATYTTEESLVGAFVRLKQGYENYHVTVLDYLNGAFRQVNYSSSVQTWQYPPTDVKSRSIVIVITEKEFSTLNASNLADNVMVAFGVNVEMDETVEEIEAPVMYMEYGKAPLANVMHLSFEKGPYDEVLSVTTGIQSYDAIENVVITYEVNSNNGGLTAYANEAIASGYVTFHAVCMKIEMVKQKIEGV